MDFQETFKITGALSIKKYDSQGTLVDSRFVPNLVVTTGKQFIASRMKDASTTVMGWMSVGSGVTSPALGDTTLGSEFVWGRSTITSTNVSSNVVTYTATFGAGTSTSGVLTEAGIFNASTGGLMLCRTTFGAVTKTDSDTITIQWSVTIS